MASRAGSTAGWLGELVKDQVTPIFFVKLEFDSGDLLLWSGYGNLTWDSQTWTGTSRFGRLSKIEETAELRAAQMQMSLNGIDSSIISIALAEDYQERPGSVWIGFLDSAGAVVADPYKFFGGRMDVMFLEDDGETANIALTIENRIVDFERPAEGVVTHEDQQMRYAGDLGLEFIAPLRDAQIRWGYGR